MQHDRTKPGQRCAWRYCLPGLLILGALILQCACVGKDPTPANEQDPGAGGDQAETPAPTAVTVPAALTPEMGAPLPSGHPKLASSLSQLVKVHREEGATSAQAFAHTHMIVLEDGRVQVELIVLQGAVESTIEAVEAEGGVVQGHRGTLVQGWVPIGALESLAERQDVQVIREARRAGQ